MYSTFYPVSENLTFTNIQYATYKWLESYGGYAVEIGNDSCNHFNRNVPNLSSYEHTHTHDLCSSHRTTVNWRLRVVWSSRRRVRDATRHRSAASIHQALTRPRTTSKPKPRYKSPNLDFRNQTQVQSQTQAPDLKTRLQTPGLDSTTQAQTSE